VYNKSMENTNLNPYIQYAVDKGFTVAEATSTKATKKTFPCTIGARAFNTQEEYDEALANFLNGY
jgi:hypothetical protein